MLRALQIDTKRFFYVFASTSFSLITSCVLFKLQLVMTWKRREQKWIRWMKLCWATEFVLIINFLFHVNCSQIFGNSSFLHRRWHNRPIEVHDLLVQDFSSNFYSRNEMKSKHEDKEENNYYTFPESLSSENYYKNKTAQWNHLNVSSEDEKDWLGETKARARKGEWVDVDWK